MGTATAALLDRDALAARLGISTRHLDDLRREGKIGPRPIRLGKSLRFDAREIARWIAAGCPPRSQWPAQSFN